ncbi:MAG: phytanoyl-CoA dioxygenase, partial [Candidatus Nephrothrix sp. EaCA]
MKKDAVKIFRGEYGTIEGLMSVEPGETDEEALKKYVAVHFPHKISPVIKDFLAAQSIVNVLTKAVSPNVKCMQSMLFVKGP